MKQPRLTHGQSILGILFALTIFGLTLTPLVQAGGANRQALWTRMRSAERVVEVHRLARWAAAHSEDELKRLPATPGEPPPDWKRQIAAQLAASEAQDGSDALAGADVRFGLEQDVRGRRKLHRLTVELRGTGAFLVTAVRLVSVR